MDLKFKIRNSFKHNYLTQTSIHILKNIRVYIIINDFTSQEAWRYLHA